MFGSVSVKICGITNLSDAKYAAELGADMLGFNFYPQSPRYIHPDKAIKIIEKLPATIEIVALFVNASFEDIHKVAQTGYFDWLQLHGDETPDFCRKVNTLNIKTIKAIRVKTADDIEKAHQYNTNAILFDAFSPEEFGGTGKTFDWKLIINSSEKKIFLAGGITLENVKLAIESGANAIDLCSGVESSPGIKDHARMKLLFDNIKI